MTNQRTSIQLGGVILRAGKRLFLLFFLAGMCGHAQAQTWKTDVDGKWGANARWTPNTAPDSPGANVTLGAIITTARTIDLQGTTYTLGTLNISNTAGSYTVGSSVSDGTLKFKGGNSITTSAATATIDSDIKLVGDIDITTNGSAALAINGDIDENSVSNLAKDGTGNLTLSGNNSFSGGFDVNAGTLTAGSTTALGDVGNDGTVGSGATLALNGFSNTISSMTITGGNITTGSGTLTLSSATALTSVASSTASTITGNIRLSATNATINVGNGAAGTDLTINGKLTASTGFTKSGLGVLALTGNQSNVTGGTITVGAGTLALDKTSGASAISAGSIVVNSGGTLLIQANDQIANTVGITLHGGTFNVQSGSDTVGALTLSSSSTIDLSATGATLKFADSHTLAWSGTLTILNYTSADYLGFGTSASGLTSAQINDISFNIGGNLFNAGILSTGQIVPVPEAPKIFAVMILVGVVALKGLVDRRMNGRREGPGDLDELCVV